MSRRGEFLSGLSGLTQPCPPVISLNTSCPNRRRRSHLRVRHGHDHCRGPDHRRGHGHRGHSHRGRYDHRGHYRGHFPAEIMLKASGASWPAF